MVEPKQVMHCKANTVKQWLGRLRKNWIYTIKQDLKETGMFWEEEQERCGNRQDWQCGPLCL